MKTRRSSRVVASSSEGNSKDTLVEYFRSRKAMMRAGEFAEIMSISERQVRSLIQTGRLPGIRIGGSIRIDPYEIARWLDSKRTA